MKILVKALTGTTYNLDVDDFDTIKEVKIKINDITGIPTDFQSFWLNLINNIMDLILFSETHLCWKTVGRWLCGGILRH